MKKVWIRLGGYVEVDEKLLIKNPSQAVLQGLQKSGLKVNGDSYIPEGENIPENVVDQELDLSLNLMFSMKQLFKTISEHRGHSVTCKKNVDNPDIAEIWCDKCSVIIFSVNKKDNPFRYERVLAHQNLDISSKDHEITCVTYADVNAAIECESCGEVIMDCDK